jgi:hypothetical protein
MVNMVQDPFHGMTSLHNDFISNERALRNVARHFSTKRLDPLSNALEDLLPVPLLEFFPSIPAIERLHDHQDIGRQIFEHVKDGYFRSIAIRYSDGVSKGVIGILREIRGIKYSVHSLEIGIHSSLRFLRIISRQILLSFDSI